MSKRFLSIFFSSSSSGSFGSSSSSFGGSNVKPPKKESKVKKRLKQAALIGAGAYVGYKLGKLKEKFSNRKIMNNIKKDQRFVHES